MHNVSNIYRVSLYSSEEEDGVDDVTEAVDATYSNTLGTGPTEKNSPESGKISVSKFTH